MSQSKVELPGAHGLSALIPRRRDGRCVRLAIGLLFREDTVRRLGEMAGHGADGLLVPLAPADALVEATDVTTRRAAAIETDGVGGFDEGPLEVAIDVWTGWPEAGLPAAGVDAWRGARVGSHLLGGGEPCNAADLERDHDGEHEADAGQGQEQLNGGRGLEHGLHLVLEPAHLTVQSLDLLEQLLSSVRRTGRKEREPLAEEGAASHAEEIADLQMVEGVLGQGGVNAIFELRALADEHHARARQVTLIAQLARGNPDRGQGPVALELIEPADVEPIGLVDLAHHQFRLAGVHELGPAAGWLHLVDDSIPVADRLHRDWRARLTSRQKLLQGSPLMREPLFADEPTVRANHRPQRVMLVGIERDIFHVLRLLSRLTPSSDVQRPR